MDLLNILSHHQLMVTTHYMKPNTETSLSLIWISEIFGKSLPKISYELEVQSAY